MLAHRLEDGGVCAGDGVDLPGTRFEQQAWRKLADAGVSRVSVPVLGLAAEPDFSREHK